VTTQISIAVSRHRRRLTVINKRYVREKRKRDTAKSGTDLALVDFSQSAGAAAAADTDALITARREFGINY